jgi:hypothetical protein
MSSQQHGGRDKYGVDSLFVGVITVKTQRQNAS